MSLLREAERCLANQKLHSALNAFITPLQPGQWLDRVRDADQRHEQGRSKSRLDGRLISIKDNICTRDLPTTCASGILDSFTSPFNATVVDQLENSGAVIAGKTNLDEFGMGSHSTNSRFGPVRSLRRDEGGEMLSAGGSSGGAAVAVASGQCYAALGTDTGGSIRLPAAYTGIVGFKPSYGLVSRWGVVAYSNSLDTVGFLGRDTSSIRDIFGIVNKPDPRDPTNITPSTRSRIQSHIKSPHLASRTSSPLKIGVPIEYNIIELSPSVRKAWHLSLTHLRKQGHTIHPVSLPSTKQALSAYYILAPAEASSNLAKYDGIRYGTRSNSNTGEEYLYANTRAHGFGDEVKRRILLGTFSLSAAAVDNYFIQAQRVRRLVQGDFDAVFRAEHPLSSRSLDGGDNKGDDGADTDVDVDVLVFPTAPFSPPRLSSLLDGDSKSPLDAYMNDVLTVPASLAGLPAMSVPVTVGDDQVLKEDLAGIQVVGQYGNDELVLNVGEALEGRRL